MTILKYLFYLLLPGLLFSQFQKTSKTMVDVPMFEAHAKLDNRPKPFIKLDSLLNNLYAQGSKDINVAQIVYEESDEKLLEYAKLLTLINTYPDSVILNYKMKANKPWNEQLKHKMQITQNAKVFNEVRQIKPGALMRSLEEQIYKRLPWEWEFHLKNKYILFIEVQQTSFKKLGAFKDINAPYYHVRVLDDLKGNFNGKEIIELSGNHIVGKMESGRRYIVFIKYKHRTESHYGLRGLATDDYGFLPVDDNVIIDKNNVLQMNETNIKIDDFKKGIEIFFNEIKGDNNEN